MRAMSNGSRSPVWTIVGRIKRRRCPWSAARSIERSVGRSLGPSRSKRRDVKGTPERFAQLADAHSGAHPGAHSVAQSGPPPRLAGLTCLVVGCRRLPLETAAGPSRTPRGLLAEAVTHEALFPRLVRVDVDALSMPVPIKLGSKGGGGGCPARCREGGFRIGSQIVPV